MALFRSISSACLLIGALYPNLLPELAFVTILVNLCATAYLSISLFLQSIFDFNLVMPAFVYAVQAAGYSIVASCCPGLLSEGGGGAENEMMEGSANVVASKTVSRAMGDALRNFLPNEETKEILSTLDEKVLQPRVEELRKHLIAKLKSWIEKREGDNSEASGKHLDDISAEPLRSRGT